MSLVMDTRPAAYVVVLEQGRILLSHFVAQTPEGPISGWTLPGGGIEVGEQPAEAAVRETYEETGYRVDTEQLLGVHCGYFTRADSSVFCAHRTVFRAHIVGGDLACEVGGSTDDVRWVPLAELVDYLPLDQPPHLLIFLDAVATLMGYEDAAQWALSARRGEKRA